MKWMVVVVLMSVIGCGKGDKAASSGSAAPAGSGSAAAAPAAGSGSAVATPAAGSGSATPAAAASSGTCEAACARRKDCSVPGGDDVTKCTTDCKSLADVFTGDALAQYTNAPCAEVAQGETVFRATVACKAACSQRAKCIPEGKDEKQCLGDCTAVAIVAGDSGVKDIETYATSSCDTAKAQEPAFQAISSCVAGCQHVLQCGVEGTFPGCLTECATNIGNKSLTVDQVVAIAKDNCEHVKQTVKLGTSPPAAAPAGGGGGGDCAALCRKLDGCSLVTYDGCMKEGCAGFNPANIPEYVAATCQDIRSGYAIKRGQRCVRDGTQDCKTGMMCCYQTGNKYIPGDLRGRATNAGEQGQCLYAALCYR